MGGQDYFTVESTAITLPKRGILAIYAGDKPRKDANGRAISFSLRGPMLLMPPEMWHDDSELIAKVAKLLNANAHLFFDSAKDGANAGAGADDTQRALLRRAHDAMSRREPDGISTEEWDALVADMAKELGVCGG